MDNIIQAMVNILTQYTYGKLGINTDTSTRPRNDSGESSTRVGMMLMNLRLNTIQSNFLSIGIFNIGLIFRSILSTYWVLLGLALALDLIMLNYWNTQFALELIVASGGGIDP